MLGRCITTIYGLFACEANPCALVKSCSQSVWDSVTHYHNPFSWASIHCDLCSLADFSQYFSDSSISTGVQIYWLKNMNLRFDVRLALFICVSLIFVWLFSQCVIYHWVSTRCLLQCHSVLPWIGGFCRGPIHVCLVHSVSVHCCFSKTGTTSRTFMFWFRDFWMTTVITCLVCGGFSL